MNKTPNPYHVKILELEKALDDHNKEKVLQWLESLEEERLDIMPEVEYEKYARLESRIKTLLGK